MNGTQSRPPSAKVATEAAGCRLAANAASAPASNRTYEGVMSEP
jgi:hypothetical protein